MKFNRLFMANFTREKFALIAHLFIIGIWGLAQFSLGNKYLVFLIIAFLAMLVLLRSRPLTFLKIFILIVLILNTSMTNTWIKLREANISAYQNAPLSLSNLLTPNSGQEVLPPRVQEMLSLLKANNISNYDLSNNVVQDPLISERIVESAWPIKLKRKSFILLSYVTELEFYPKCDLIDKREEMALVRCH